MAKRFTKTRVRDAGRLFAALGDPTRLGLVVALSAGGPESITALSDTADVRRDRLGGLPFADRNLLESGGVEDPVDPAGRFLESLTIANVAESQLEGEFIFEPASTELVLLCFVTREADDPSGSPNRPRANPLEERTPERTGDTGDQQLSAVEEVRVGHGVPC